MKYRIVVLLFVVSSLCQAQQILTLDDCIQLAKERNHNIVASKAKVLAAEARYKDASSTLFPQIKLTARAFEVSPVPELKLPPPLNQAIFPSITEQYGIRLTLQQPIFMGLKLQKNKSVAEYALTASKAEAQKEESDVVIEVVSSYWNYVRLQQTEDVLLQMIRSVEQHMNDIKNFFEQGLASDIDVLKVRVQLADLRVQLIEVKNSKKVAQMYIHALIGYPLEHETTIYVDTTLLYRLHSDIADEPIEKQTALAVSGRPEITYSALQLKINKELVGIANSNWYPQIMLQANYDYAKPNQRILPYKNRWDDTWEVGIALQWTLWDWCSTHYQSVQAEQAVIVAQERLKQIEEKVTLEVAQYTYALRAAVEKLKAVDEEVTAAEESYRTGVMKFKAGYLSSTELTDIETSLIRAKVSRANAWADYNIALAKYKKSLGQL